jgi:hypothetical protein
LLEEKLLINQSMVKDLAKYSQDELCGLIFQNKWITKQLGHGSKANDLGHFFEFLSTGAFAKGEASEPRADRTKKGELTSEFRTAQKQAGYFKEVISKYGIEIVEAGKKEIAEDQWIGTLDIEAKWDDLYTKYGFKPDPKNPNNLVVIDLKYSALLEDKWTDFGWHLDRLADKWGTMFQAKHYCFLFWKKYGFIPPFFFFVFDSKTVGVCKVIHIEIDEFDLERHEEYLIKSKHYLEQQLEIGFKAKPTYAACKDCAYSKWCAEKIEVPPIVTIIPQ